MSLSTTVFIVLTLFSILNVKYTFKTDKFTIFKSIYLQMIQADMEDIYENAKRHFAAGNTLFI